MEYKLTSHENFEHDSIDSLAYDWERMANPSIAPKYPFKVYLPRTTEDVVAAVRETLQLGQKLVVRSKGHSSNDLVTAEGGAILCIENLDAILDLDLGAKTVTVQAGMVLAELDDFLAGHGHGLPIIGDHNHITAGGFASVGGISPASHRFGMFVDNVAHLEYVSTSGEVIACDRSERPADFYAVLTGCGQRGVIVTLTLDIIRVDKFKPVLANDRKLFGSVQTFLAESERRIQDPGEAQMERGLWLDYPVGSTEVTVGQFSTYLETSQSPLKSAVNRVHYGYLHALGRVAGRLPKAVDLGVKYLGMAGVLLSPLYASIKNVETFTDKILESSVGDPTRMFIALVPVRRYRPLFERLYRLAREYRAQFGCFTFVSIYVKAIRSPYLATDGRDPHFAELMLYVGVEPGRLRPEVLEDFVSRFDDLCIEERAFRYMHSRTVKDEARRRRIDPNAHHTGAGTRPRETADGARGAVRTN